MPHPRALSSLVGLAVGDCLGAPVEGSSPAAIHARYGQLRDFQYAAPIWTDDTQQALVLAEATVRHGVPDPDWVARRYVEMSHPRSQRQFGCHRGTGRGFRGSVMAFEESGDWRASGRPDRAGNGAAMRIGPAAAALSDLPDDEFARALVEVSMVTHREVRAVTGGLAVGRLAGWLARESAYPLPRDRARALLRELIAWLSERESWLEREYPQLAPYAGERDDVSTLLSTIDQRWGSPWPELELAICDFASQRLGRIAYASEGYVLSSVITAIATVLRSEESFEETVIEAVNLGGDADTLAAMVGGMAGAAAGLEAIPERWRCFAGHDELIVWGSALAGEPTADLEQLPDLVTLEQRLWRKLRGQN